MNEVKRIYVNFPFIYISIPRNNYFHKLFNDFNENFIRFELRAKSNSLFFVNKKKKMKFIFLYKFFFSYITFPRIITYFSKITMVFIAMFLYGFTSIIRIREISYMNKINYKSSVNEILSNNLVQFLNLILIAMEKLFV